jgi:hypothetical protein
MSRTESKKAIQRAVTVCETSITCDSCGGEIGIDPSVHPDQFANELYIALNGDECVNQLRRRDYCNVCLEPIWEKINELIHANPEQDGTDPADEQWHITR